MLSAKRAVADIWPIHKKTFFVLLDPESITAEDGAPTSIPTVASLVARKARVIVAASFGSLQGIAINATEKQRDVAVEAFQAEGGLGLTNCFANMSPKEKLRVLSHLPSVPESCNANRGTGKTTYFSKQPTDAKLSAIEAEFPALQFSDVSTATIAQKLRDLVGAPVLFAPDCLNASKQLGALRPGEILVLENLRFYRNETSSSPDERVAMAEVLASYCDVFINDSFASAHEVKASTVALPKILRHGAAGCLMDKELSYFKRLLTHPARPTGVVVGGTHVAEKLRLINSLLGKVEKIMVAGEVSLPFLASRGLSCGKGFDASRVIEMNGETLRMDQWATRILRHAAAIGVKIVLPCDYVAHSTFEYTRNPTITQGHGVPSELFAMDVGPATLQLFAQEVRGCRTLFWSGTLGVASIPGYDAGTDAFAKSLASSGVFSVVGGRHTTRCVRNAGVAKSMSHLCSGGVACLEVLQANLLPGVEVLTDAAAELDQRSVANVNELLRHLPLFSGCTSHQLGIIAKKAVRRVYNAGDFIVYDGDRYTSMYVVAGGSLVACPKSEYGNTIAVRCVSKGHAVGLYEFVTMHTAAETVQVTDNDTVLYQITNASLHEAMNESPELACQLIANLAEPLRLVAVREHEKAASVWTAVQQSLSSSRVPDVFPSRHPYMLGSDLVSDCIETVALNKLSLLYRPIDVQSGTCMFAQFYDGVVARLLMSVTRNLVFCRATHFVKPIPAAVIAAVVTAPLRLLASGVPLHKLTVDDTVESALVSSALALAPAASHALFVKAKAERETSQRAPLTAWNAVALAAVCRVVVGAAVYPLVAKRGCGLLNLRSFVAYLIKQVAALLLHVATVKYMQRRRR